MKGKDRAKNIVLIGMRGAGKTTVGRILAKRLKRKFIELDEEIVKKVGMTIPLIVEKYGWEYFRQVESDVVCEFSKVSNSIISTGGGVVLRRENIDNLKKNGVLFFLKARVSTLVARVGEDPNRPPLTSASSLEEEFLQVWQERKKLYYQSADFIVDTEGKTQEEVANEILALI